jgi:hypothetical protein
LAHFFGASSFAQKYSPPAFGNALASSDREIPTHTDVLAISVIPYIIRRGPPELIPATKAADMPNQEFVR